MTSLPIPTSEIEQNLPMSVAVPPKESTLVLSGLQDEQFLLQAFRSFAAAAGTLESSYGKLHGEVERLRRELEKSDTDLARSLEENRGMREYLDRILEGLPCGVLVLSGHDRITRTNPEAVRLLGLTAARLESLAKLPGSIQELLASARKGTGEQEAPSQGGAKSWLSARHASIADGTSIFILRDVTERKQLEQAQAKLGRERALAEMAAILAHEIRNPLGSLELFAGLLAESDLEPECRKWVEHVQAGLRTLAATVNNVLHFHSLPEPERARLDLGRLLEWASEFLMPLARQSNVALSLQNRLDRVFLSADRHRLEQVLLNLVLNALRAMPGGGWVELCGRKCDHGRSVMLTVSDTGPGIPEEHLAGIFEPGYSTRTGSPGLGLAVSRKIVEQHGGSITALSAAGRGATFTIIFPLSGKLSGGLPNEPCSGGRR